MSTWDIAAVVAFIESLELLPVAPLFREACVTGADLLDLTADDLIAMGVSNHMHRKKILKQVQRWAAAEAKTDNEDRALQQLVKTSQGAHRGKRQQQETNDGWTAAGGDEDEAGGDGHSAVVRDSASAAQQQEEQEEQERRLSLQERSPVRYAILRMVLTVAIFFTLHTLVQHFILDPLAGRGGAAMQPRSHADLVREAEAIQQRVGPDVAAFIPRPL